MDENEILETAAEEWSGEEGWYDSTPENGYKNEKSSAEQINVREDESGGKGEAGKEEREKSPEYEGEASISKRNAEFVEFIELMPDVSPADIPQEVWREVAAGKRLLTAYIMYENAKLKAELAAERQNHKNREASVSSRSCEGSGLKLGELERLWYAED